METKLYRSRTDSMLGGVCGGLGQYLRIDPVLIRLFFVLLTLGGGSGVLLYLVLWVVIPAEGQGTINNETFHANTDEIAARARILGQDIDSSIHTPHPQAALLIGASLVILGGIYLLRNLGIAWLGWLEIGTLWPVLLILGGGALMLRRAKGA